jgi:hypothetical protein
MILMNIFIFGYCNWIVILSLKYRKNSYFICDLSQNFSLNLNRHKLDEDIGL